MTERLRRRILTRSGMSYRRGSGAMVVSCATAVMVVGPPSVSTAPAPSAWRRAASGPAWQRVLLRVAARDAGGFLDGAGFNRPTVQTVHRSRFALLRPLIVLDGWW